MEFRKLKIQERIPPNFRLTTVSEAERQLSAIEDQINLSDNLYAAKLRLKNGYMEGKNVVNKYSQGLEFKLVGSSPSTKPDDLCKPTQQEEKLTAEDCLMALAYAAEHDDVDDDEKQLLELAGRNILNARMSVRSESPIRNAATILHVCAYFGNNRTLVKLVDMYPHDIPPLTKLVDSHGDTPLHYAALSTSSFPKIGDVACLILQTSGDANYLLSLRNEFHRGTPLCTALVQGKKRASKALLNAAHDVQYSSNNELGQESGDEEAHAEQSVWLESQIKDDGFTALHIAVAKGYVDIVDQILAYPGAKRLKLLQDISHDDGANPLHLAVVSKNIEICGKLLRYHASIEGKNGVHYDAVNALNKHGQTPLHLAAYLGLDNICQQLLDSGASMVLKDKAGRCPLLNALLRNHISVVKALLHHGIRKIESGNAALINQKFGSGLTLLHVAAAISDHNTHPFLLYFMRNGAFVDVIANDGRTPLHIASQNGCADKFWELEENKLKFSNEMMHPKNWVNLRDSSGQTALHIAVKSSSLFGKTQVESLLQHGALGKFRNNDGETPLHIAARECNNEIVEVLLSDSQGPYDRDKLIAMCDFSGETALHEAARRDCFDTVKLLLDKISSPAKLNALLWVRDAENRTALQWAVHRENRDIVQEMMERADDMTKCFLFWNAIRTHPQAEQFLMNFINEEPESSLSKSLLQLAFEKQDLDMARDLINRGADASTLKDDARRWLSKNLCRKALDRPAADDSLGRKPLVDGVASLLVNPYTGTPITIGLFGGWGTGKSSFMSQVEDTLLCMSVKETFKKTTPSKYERLLEIGRALREKVNKALWKLKSLQNRNAQENSVTQWGESKQDASNNIENRQLSKDLASTDRSKLVRSEAVAATDQVGQTPAVLTVLYNAWRYDNKIEASAGLAVEISKRLEDSMTPSQWMRMSFHYSWNSGRMDIFVQLLLPVFVALVAACLGVLLWRVAPINVEYKFLTLPVGIFGVIWLFFQTFLRVVQPVTETIVKYIKSPDHKSILGYQQRVIDDINFLKRQLCEEAHFPWTILGLLGQFFMSNSYYMKDTRVRKQHPQLDNLRIVVFIDNLDRCDEKTVLEVLRVISLILGECAINVVIGIDKDMVKRAIIKEFLKDTGDKMLEMIEQDIKTDHPGERSAYTRDLADKYMQKIIQLPIQMPDPSPGDFQNFVEGEIGVLELHTAGEEERQENKGVDEENPKPPRVEEDEKEESYKQIKLPDVGPVDEEEDETKNDERGEDEDPAHNRSGQEEHNRNVEGNLSHTVEIYESDATNTPPRAAASLSKKPFRLLVKSYSPPERELLVKLCHLVTGEQKLPREWKRFLNYHRLSWSILSQDPTMENKCYKGWQRKLILWIFVCWNWRDQINVIIEVCH